MEIDTLHEGIQRTLCEEEFHPTAEQQRLGAAKRLGILAAADRPGPRHGPWAPENAVPSPSKMIQQL